MLDVRQLRLLLLQEAPGAAKSQAVAGSRRQSQAVAGSWDCGSGADTSRSRWSIFRQEKSPRYHPLFLKKDGGVGGRRLDVISRMVRPVECFVAGAIC